MMSALQGNLLEMLGIRKQSWRSWKEVSLLSALFMELSWIAPWLRALLQGEEIASQMALTAQLALLGVLSFLFIRISAALALKRTTRLLTLLGILIVLLPGSMALMLYPTEQVSVWTVFSRFATAMRFGDSLLPNEFLAALAIVFVWLRAIRWAAADGLPSEMIGRFKSGFLILLVYVVVFVRLEQTGLGIFIYSFFFFAWMAMGAARLARTEAQPAAGEDFFTPKWLLAVFAGLLFTALALAALGLGINSQFALVQQAALTVWLLLWGLIILLLSPFIIAISWIFEYLLGRVDRSAGSSLQTNTGTSIEEISEVLKSLAPPAFLQSLIDWLNSLNMGGLFALVRGLIMWGVFGLVLFLGLYYAGRRIGFWKAISDDMQLDMQREESDDWWRSLTDAWRRRLDELRRSLARFADPRLGRRLLAAARIRRVYTYLMDLSAELGKARLEAQTPLEFIPTLSTVFPHHTADVETISKAYMRVRYGELDETPSDVIEVDRAWLQLRLEGEHIKKNRKKKRQEAEKDEA